MMSESSEKFLDSQKFTYQDRRSLMNWIQEAHPEIFKEWRAVRDIERAVEREQVETGFGEAPMKAEGSKVNYG